MDDCIFCKLVNHEIPTTVRYEDDLVFAFDDMSPQAPVHILIIPKKHYKDISDGVPALTVARMIEVGNILAVETGIYDKGYRLILNKGSDAGQTVFHLHMHLLGGRTMPEGFFPDGK